MKTDGKLYTASNAFYISKFIENTDKMFQNLNILRVPKVTANLYCIYA